MSTIAIYGANGYAGDAIHAEALRRGHTVLAFSRSGTPRAGSAQTDVAKGDIHDEAALAKVARQADAVIIAIPARDLDGKTLLDAVPSLLDLSAEYGTRIGIVGGAGSLKVSENGPLLLEGEHFPAVALPEARAHGEVLAALRSSTKGDWFYVSPAAMFGAHAPMEPAGGYLVGGDVLTLNAKGETTLSAVDLASAFLDEIEKPAHANKRFSVVGAY